MVCSSVAIFQGTRGTFKVAYSIFLSAILAGEGSTRGCNGKVLERANRGLRLWAWLADPLE